MIVVRCILKPTLAPPVRERFTRADIRQAIAETWALPVIIIGVLSGIFLGVFTPTSAGAVGAALAIVVALLRRSLTLAVMAASIRQTLIGTSSIFMVVIGTALLGKFMALSGVPTFVAQSFVSFGTSQMLVLLAIALLYLFLGCFLDSIGILLLTMPIILPMANESGLDLIYLGIILVKLLEIGLLTPPVGLNVYVIKGALGDRVALTAIFRGVGWFIAVDLVVLTFLISFPQISLWLPSLMQ